VVTGRRWSFTSRVVPWTEEIDELVRAVVTSMCRP
jgi:hypothetical protein